MQYHLYRDIYFLAMKLKGLASLISGYHSRTKIESLENGSHYLLQARDVDGERLIYQTDTLIRFNPDLSPTDGVLKRNDILFMAKGAELFGVVGRSP